MQRHGYMSHDRLMQCCARDSLDRYVQRSGYESQDGLRSAAPARPWTASCSATAICPRTASAARRVRLPRPLRAALRLR
eukprot:15068165-Alexandrium_andersonii.AAC.1